MKTCKFLVLVLLSIAVVSCKKSRTKLDDPQQGTITVSSDESFRSVAEALTERYMALFPETKINLVIQKEDLGFLALLDKKVRVAILSRELTSKEKEAYRIKIGDEIVPARFAADAVVFITGKNSSVSELDMEDIKRELQSETKRFVFDGTNSSNLNFVAQKIGAKPSDLKFSIINGNENVVNQIASHPDKIGVISLNTFSRPYDKKAEELRSSVRILPVKVGGKSYLPEVQNLRDLSYPFSRVLYFLTTESYYGLGNGFIRFASQQLGQIIVRKEGLQPYNIFRREVQMH